MTAVSPEAPSSRWRRPQLTLDGVWGFAFEGPTARLADAAIRSPGVWQAQFPALRNAQGTGRYRRRIEIPHDWRGQRVFLVMDGVFHESVILVDEVPVAVHGDGWTPIEIDLTDALDGKTSFVLGVDARTPDDRDGGRFSRSLAGKQDWYGVQGGIWKPAWLEARDPAHLGAVEAQTSYDLATGTVTVKGRLVAARPGRRSCRPVAGRRAGRAWRNPARRRGVRSKARRFRSGPVVAGCSEPLSSRRRTAARQTL